MMTPSTAIPSVSVRKTFRLHARWSTLLVQLLLFAVLLGIWETGSGSLFDPYFVSKPSAVFQALVRWAENGTLVDALSYTLSATAIGFLVGATAGFVTGVILGRARWLSDILQPFITAINCLPKVALAPLFVMWFGIGLASKVAMVGMIVFFLVFLNTYAGMRDVSAEHIRALRVMGAGDFQILRYVLIPSAMAWVLAGLQISVPYSLIGAVVAEMISSNRGLGFLISQSAGIFDTAGVFAAIAALVAVGLVVNMSIKRAEAYFLRWR